MDNDIIYADEQETCIIRVGDVIQVIAEQIGLQVIEMYPVKRKEDVQSGFNALRFPDKKPLALWWFSVTFASQEGKREAMVLVALEEQGLRVVTFDRPALLFFGEAVRGRAKGEASALTQEYIDQLEQALKRAQLLWKTANEYAKDVPGLRDELYMFFTEYRKVGYLLSDAKEGGPQGLGMRKVYLPSWQARTPDQYITGDDEVV